MKLDANGAIIDPILGDSEITRIDFMIDGAVIHFKTALDHETFRLELRHVRWMSFTTNHTQNVVESVNITTDLENLDVPDDVQGWLSRRKLRISGDEPRPEPLMVVRIKDIAGPDMLAIVHDVRDLDATC